MTCEVDTDESAIDGALGVGEGGASKLVSGGDRAVNGSEGADVIDNLCFFEPFVYAEIETNGLFF